MLAMTALLTAEGISQEFECAGVKAVEAKLGRFKVAGPARMHVLLDFDRTLTVGKRGDDDATTWQILQRHLSPEGQARYQSDFQHYRQLEIAGTMTEADALEWWQSTLQLFIDGQVNLRKVEADFLSVVQLRPGARELLAACHQAGIQTTILSAGITDVIQILLGHYRVSVDLVISTQLITDNDGVITGWHKDDMVHVLNKHEAGHAPLEQVKADRPYCIVVGDSLDDAAMINGDQNVLRVRVVDPRAGETVDQAHILQQTFQKFDLAVTTGGLQAVADLVAGLAA